jgi:hypothetical protein
MVSNQDLLNAYATPIRSGWKLWIRSLPALSLHSVPLAIAMVAVIRSPAWLALDGTGKPTAPATAGISILVVLAAVGIAMTQVVMTEKHTGLVRGNPYLWALKRFVPWLITLALVLVATLAGYVALILPGIYVALRLFWADEFTLIHGSGPLRGLKDSWELTRESAGAIFAFQFLAGLASYLIVLPFIVVLAVLIPMTADSEDGLLFVLAISFWAFFTAYAGLHAPEVVYFYGMRARQAMTLSESTKTLGI